MMSPSDALRMNMMISYQELVRTFLSKVNAIPIVKKGYKNLYKSSLGLLSKCRNSFRTSTGISMI